ncbi:MAG: DNA-directed RNA polymerase subunit RpoH/Rpb5 C-terminal domain-containing protein [Candidatus Micrarchaeia archaeon]
MNSEIDIANHYLVPPHRVLSQQEVEQVLNKLGLSVQNLPKILANDPQVVKLKAKVGNVIEIDRGKEGKYYRLVVPAL